MKMKFIILIIVGALVLAAGGTVLGIMLFGKDMDTLADYISAQENTVPTETKVNVSVETSVGTLNSTLTTTYNEDGSSLIKYSYEKFNEIGVGEEKSTVFGEIVCDANGNYSGAVSGAVGTAASIKLTLDASIMQNVSFDEGICSSIIKADNTEDAFGVDIGADVKLTLYKADGKITSSTIVYKNEQGAVSIICEYK